MRPADISLIDASMPSPILRRVMSYSRGLGGRARFLGVTETSHAFGEAASR